MSTKFTHQNHKRLSVLFFFLMALATNAQIGIGTVTPNATSILDITSTTQGLLTPRMTTAQRVAIASPAEGLLVYDTDLKLFYYYSGTWNPLNSTASGRLNFKRIKSTDVLSTVLAAELAAGGGTKYVLNSSTLYEINGTINFTLPIDLNNAYITGQDANEDIIKSTASAIFQGSTGGSIRFVTLQGVSAFNITGPGPATATSLLIQNVVVNGMTTSVGSISGFGLYFGNIIQYVGNANGIQYSNIGNLLLSNQAWTSSNSGTFETYYGTFGLIQKNSGFSTLDGADVAIDVTGTLGALNVGTGIIVGTVFSGTTTNSTGYIKGYPAASTFTGFNFSTAWTVDSPGIPREGDSDATGEFSMDYPVGSGANTAFNNVNPSTIVKVVGNSTATNLFRFSNDGGINNRLKYLGRKKRIFHVSGSISFQVTSAGTYIIYVAKNGAPITSNKIYGRGLQASDIVVLPINVSVELATNDYVEVFAQRYSGGTNDQILTPNMSVIVR